MFDYSDKPRPEDAVVTLVKEAGTPYGPELERSLAQQALRCGFTFRAGPVAPGTRSGTGAPRISHIIYCAAGGFSWPLVHAVGALLLEHSSVSLALSYATLEEFRAAESLVGEAKARYGDRLNFLRPDELVEGALRASVNKLADNAVCDTVRVKYEPRLRSRAAPPIDERSAEYMALASSTYRRRELFHRSPTDGYFAIRCGASGFLVTATKTDKCSLDPARLVMVHGYDEASNVVEYSGGFLPSSDAVEAAVLLSERPDLEYLYHTHASRLFTRNEAFEDLIAVGRLSYGEPELGHALAAAVDGTRMDCVIMDDHGEVFFGTASETPRQFFRKIERYCDEAAATLPQMAWPQRVSA